jgi:hypothetical protein
MFSEQLPIHSIDSVEQYVFSCNERIIKISDVYGEIKLNVTWKTILIRKHETEIILCSNQLSLQLDVTTVKVVDELTVALYA